MRRLSSVVFLLLFALMCGTAQAAGVWNVTIGPESGLNDGQYYTTGSLITVNNNNGYLPGMTSFNGFCVDLSSEIWVPWTGNVQVDTAVIPPPPISAASWGRISWIYEQYGYNTVLGSAQAQAVQEAIWQAVSKDETGSLRYASGQYGGYAQWTALAEQYYNASDGQSAAGSVLFLSRGTAESGAGTQAFLGGIVTPEGSSAALLAPGLLALIVATRRRSAKAARRPVS